MKKLILIVLAFACLALFSFTLIAISTSQAPPNEGFVPDEKTAVKVAESVWLPVFGNDIYSHQPFKAELIQGKCWKVYGTGNKQNRKCPFALIQRKNCMIIKIAEIDEKFLSQEP
jgi:hypothetical protein